METSQAILDLKSVLECYIIYCKAEQCFKSESEKDASELSAVPYTYFFS